MPCVEKTNFNELFQILKSHGLTLKNHRSPSHGGFMVMLNNRPDLFLEISVMDFQGNTVCLITPCDEPESPVLPPAKCETVNEAVGMIIWFNNQNYDFWDKQQEDE